MTHSDDASHRRGRHAVRAGLAVVVVGLLGWIDGCASAGAVRLEALAPAPEVAPVWPAPPDPPRIRLLASFRSARELGFRRSFLGRVVDFVRGRDAFAHIQHPYGVAIRDDDRIYVVDSAARGVHVFGLATSDYDFLSIDDFRNPVGIALAPDGSIFVSDSEAGFVVHLDDRGEEIRRFTGDIARPTGLAVGVDGVLYVADTGAHVVRSYLPGGSEGRVLGQRGAEEGSFNYPTDVALGPDGRLYVSDSMNFRVQVFARDGGFERSFGRLGDAHGEFARPKGLAVDDAGRVFVVEGLYDVINVFDQEGRLLLAFGGPGRDLGSFWLATGLTVDDRGRVFVADSFNGRVQVFEVVGDGAAGGDR